MQLARDAATRRLEEERHEAVDERGNPAPRHLRPVAAREEAMLEVGLAHLARMGGEGISHFACINAIVTSSMRLEKPHSLSYQLQTFTSRPDTLVSVASKIDERGSWLKSTETSGPVL